MTIAGYPFRADLLRNKIRTESFTFDTLDKKHAMPTTLLGIILVRTAMVCAWQDILTLWCSFSIMEKVNDCSCLSTPVFLWDLQNVFSA